MKQTHYTCELHEVFNGGLTEFYVLTTVTEQYRNRVGNLETHTERRHPVRLDTPVAMQFINASGVLPTKWEDHTEFMEYAT